MVKISSKNQKGGITAQIVNTTYGGKTTIENNTLNAPDAKQATSSLRKNITRFIVIVGFISSVLTILDVLNIVDFEWPLTKQQ